jgi:hypothetical protein
LQAVATILDKAAKGAQQKREEAQQEYQQKVNASIERHRQAMQSIFEEDKKRREEERPYNTDCYTDNFGKVHCITKKGL